MFPSSDEETLDLIGGPSLPPLQILSRSLIDELDQIEVPFVLVLDDYHSIQEVALHGWMPTRGLGGRVSEGLPGGRGRGQRHGE
jgi:hypothetical protein